jgi:hypothetical protein
MLVSLPVVDEQMRDAVYMAVTACGYKARKIFVI